MPDIELLINPVQVKILTLDTGLIQLLDNKFKFKDPKYRYSTKIKELREKGIEIDDYKHFYSKKKSTLPIGFLNEAITFLEKKGYTVKKEDLRKIPKITIPEDYNLILDHYDWKKAKKDRPPEFRYYQEECFDEILKNKKYNGIIEGATAFGKTFVFISLTRIIDGRILIIFPSKQLVYQTYKESKLFNFDDFGLVSGKDRLVGKRVMLVNYQSLEIFEGHENAKKFNAVFIDEMHKAKANTLFKFLKKIPASIRLGFSGTPFKLAKPDQKDKLDNALNKANLGDIIYVKKAKTLIKEGFLSSININFLKMEEPLTSNYTANHIEAKDLYIVHNSYRNNVIKSIVEKYNKRTLIIVELREHGEILEELIPNSVMYVHGETDIETREEVRENLNSGQVRTVISTVVFAEGIDIPNLEMMVVACSNKSFYQVIQRIGRGLRKTKEVTHFEVFDFIDETNRHLYRWSKKRWYNYKYEGHPIKAIKMNEILQENKVNK